MARQVAARYADAVDGEGRFPAEAVAAMRSAGLLGMAVPTSLGGHGASTAAVVEACFELGQGCANAGMVFAMHQIQVACLLRHAGDGSWHRAFLARLAEEQLLLASVTTEAGSGGDVRRSTCAAERRGDSVSVEKAGCVISYGEYADAVLITARRSANSAASDQVAILAERAQCRMERVATWDALGMRGTGSHSYHLAAAVASEQVLPAGYGEISAQTMLPVSHLTWAGLWTGIATAACARARTVLRRRTTPGGTAPGGAVRLVEAMAELQGLRARVADAVRRFEAAQGDPDSLGAIPFALGLNQLKVCVSSAAIRIVGEAMLVAGLSAYRNNSPDSLGRHLRDIHSAALMIGNDRILANSATLLGGYRGDESLYP